MLNGKGWVVDRSGGVAFAAGNWQFSVNITSTGGSGTALLDVGMWIVDDSGNLIPNGTLIDPTCVSTSPSSCPNSVPGENAAGPNIALSATPNPITNTFWLGAFSLDRHQHLLVEFWRHQKTATTSGSTISTLAAYDGTALITHPTANGWPDLPALGSVPAYVNHTPQLSATYTDPDADNGTLSFELRSDNNCGSPTNLIASSTTGTLANGGNANWTPSASLTDGTYYWCVESTDSATNVSGWSVGSFVVDTAPPTVSSVTASNGNGAYNAGQTIHVQVGFSESVNVTGTPKLALNTTPVESATYVSGSGTSTLTFDYTVQPGDSVGTLDYMGTGALTLNGSTIADLAGNNGTLTLVLPGSAGSLAANKSIKIDTVPPTVSGVTASNGNGAYDAGQTIHVQVGFSEPVNVTGTPKLALNTVPGEFAMYVSGSGTSTLTFDYTVQPGDNVGTLDYTGTGALTLNGGTIADLAGNNGTLTLVLPGSAGSLAAGKSIRIDTTAPSVSLSSPAAGADLAAPPTLKAVYSSSDAGDSGALTFQLCSDSNCATILASGSSATGLVSGTTGTWKPSGLADGTYYWRVSPQDAAGNLPTPQWSAVRFFTLDTSPPTGPTPGAFTSGAGLNHPPTLSAVYNDSGAGTGSLTFEICATSSCSSPLLTGTTGALAAGATGSWTPSFLADGLYYWRVQSTDSAGNTSAWSSVLSFTVDATPPDAPVLSGAPGMRVQAAPALTAHVDDPTDPGDMARIYVQVCSDVDCTTVVTSGYSGDVPDGTLAGWQAPALADGTYYWRAMAEDSVGNRSDWSATRAFVVDTVAPAVPGMGGVGGGAEVNQPHMSGTFVSSDPGDSGALQFQLCADPDCTTVVISGWSASIATGASASWTPDAGFLEDGVYFWRVRSEDAAGNDSAWSATSSFTLDRTPPGRPRDFTAKVHGHLLTLSWRPPADRSKVRGYALIVNGKKTRTLRPTTLKLHIKLKRHDRRSFAVAAIDSAGNMSDSTRTIAAVVPRRSVKHARATSPHRH